MANTFNRRFVPSICVELWIHLVHHSPWHKNQKNLTWIKGLLSSDLKVAGFVLLSMPFNQHSGAIYLKSKSYLVVKNILRYSDRTLLSSMRSVCDVLPLRLPAVCWHGKWLHHRETWVPRGLTSLWQRGEWYEKYSLHLVFTFYLNRDTSVLELFPVVVFW